MRLTNKIRYLLCSAKFEGTPIRRSRHAHTHGSAYLFMSPSRRFSAHVSLSALLCYVSISALAFQGMPRTHTRLCLSVYVSLSALLCSCLPLGASLLCLSLGARLSRNATHTHTALLMSLSRCIAVSADVSRYWSLANATQCQSVAG
jgi:hypothetical protein